LAWRLSNYQAYPLTDHFTPSDIIEKPSQPINNGKRGKTKATVVNKTFFSVIYLVFSRQSPAMPVGKLTGLQIMIYKNNRLFE